MGINIDSNLGCARAITHEPSGLMVGNKGKAAIFNAGVNKLSGVANIGQTPTNISGSISQGPRPLPRPLPQAGIKKICVPKPSLGAVRAQASVQNPPQPAPRGAVRAQASVQNPPQPVPRGAVRAQASVQNPPQPVPRGAEDTRKPELEREVLLHPETKVMGNPWSHVLKNTVIQAENVAKVKNDVVQKKMVFQKKSHLRIKSFNFFIFTAARIPC